MHKGIYTHLSHKCRRPHTHVHAQTQKKKRHITHERMWGGGAGSGVLMVGAAQGGCSECVSFYQVKEKQGGWVGGERGRCKIYLLPSENFDPGVVNLSKESSQLNRKHEEERGDVGVGGAGMFGGGGGGGVHP